MGYKNVCLSCKRVESLGTDHSQFRTGHCPQCKSEMFFVNHKFRPPKTTDEKSWAVATYLISHGFSYCTIRDEQGFAVTYPTTLADAQEFVAKYATLRSQQIARRKHELEKHITNLRQRPQNDSRDRLLRDLNEQLLRLTQSAPVP